ncbi:MAG: DUF3828 domain-containing protein [Alphaproteobacteria bacterium]|nr:DUF3828 domain-containing protein [Alphaproteobacteria bacterium]
MRVLMILCLAAVLSACSSTMDEDLVLSDVPTPKVEEPKPDMSRPDGVLVSLYTSYFTVLNNGGAAQPGNYVDKYFTPDLAAKYAAASGKPNSPITFDIFINAREHHDLTLGEIKRTLENADHAIYDVHFTNDDEEQKVRIGMIHVGGTWQITDIDYGQGVSLAGLLK